MLCADNICVDSINNTTSELMSGFIICVQKYPQSNDLKIKYLKKDKKRYKRLNL
jgi:hypothetical protein